MSYLIQYFSVISGNFGGNVEMTLGASGCDQCIGQVGVITGSSGCDQWVGSVVVVTGGGQWAMD